MEVPKYKIVIVCTLVVLLCLAVFMGVKFSGSLGDLPSDKSIALEKLFMRASQGDTEALSELCQNIKNEDQASLEGFEVDEDLRMVCAEYRASSAQQEK